MKVLITTDWYQPVVNGVVTSVVNLADGLRSLGHEVRILTLSGNRHSYRNGEVYFVGSAGVGVIYPGARVRTARAEGLLRELVDWKPDIVHSQCEFSAFAMARWIAHACRCPMVHTYHTAYEELTHYFSPSAQLGRFLALRFSRHVLAQADAVIAPTEKIRKMLWGYGVGKPLFTVPTGLQMQKFSAETDGSRREEERRKLGFEKGDLVLAYIGRLAQEKNIGELFSILSETPESTKLLLVGDGPCRKELECEARGRGLGSRVVFTGMIAPEKIAAYYRLGDVFVSASQSETQGLTYIEAMACGLPLLCHADACLEGIVRPGRNGFLYNSVSEAADELHFFSDTDRRNAMGKEACRTVRVRFSEEGFAAAVLQIYRDCLRKAAEETAA